MKRVILFFLAIALVIAIFYFIKPPMPFSAIVGTSMNPVLNMGDLIINEEISPSEVEVGDIIIYRIPPMTQKYYKSPSVVAHRVVEIKDTTTGLIYRTKGDNNPSEDPWSIRDWDLIGRVDQQIPYLGFPILFLQSSSGRIFALIAVFLLVLNLCGSNLMRRRRKLRSRVMAEGLARTCLSRTGVYPAPQEPYRAIISLGEASQRAKEES